MTIDIEALRARVARFKDLKSSSAAFPDTKIPGHEREIFNVIGRGVTEDQSLQPSIAADPAEKAAEKARPIPTQPAAPASTPPPPRLRAGSRAS